MVWYDIGFGRCIPQTIGCSFPQFIEILMNLSKQEQREELLCVCWEIWKERNNITHGKSERSTGAIIERAQYVLDEYQRCNEVKRVVKERKELNTPIKWEKPKEGEFKLNVDEAFKCGKGINKPTNAGIGMVIRAWVGNIMAVKASPLAVAVDALHAEAYAIEDGLRFALERGYRRIICESDSLVIMKFLNDGIEVAAIRTIGECIRLLANNFISISFCYCKRLRNKVANGLAQWGRDSDVERIWLHESPDWLRSVWISDCY